MRIFSHVMLSRDPLNSKPNKTAFHGLCTWTPHGDNKVERNLIWSDGGWRCCYIFTYPLRLHTVYSLALRAATTPRRWRNDSQRRKVNGRLTETARANASHVSTRARYRDVRRGRTIFFGKRRKKRQTYTESVLKGKSAFRTPSGLCCFCGRCRRRFVWPTCRWTKRNTARYLKGFRHACFTLSINDNNLLNGLSNK